MTWTTRLAPELTRQFGIEELHDVWFLPKDWPGKGKVISLLIPECELQFCFLPPDAPAPVLCVNRPAKNKNVKQWLRTACEMGIEHNAAVTFGCDTVEQAEIAARRAAKLLPNHERAALERMYDPATRSRARLS